jgi:SAM-dependent methyltransferase
MSASPYLLANAAPHAGERFGALSALFDPVTTRHLDRLGVTSGWRCWEVGAGGPSLPSWLAARVGPHGEVLATDIDITWIADADPFDVLRHDVAAEPPPDRGFDLVHARLVLTHVPDREQALRSMVDALTPGGWLVVEDFDVAFQPAACPDAVGDHADRANRIRTGFEALLAERGVDMQFGRSLPRRLHELGLVDVGADAWMPLAVPAAVRLEIANTEQVRPALVARAVATEAELDAHIAAARDGELDIATPPLVSAWGRRPTDGDR